VWRGTRHRSWRLDTHSIAKPVAGERASSGPEARPRSRTPRIREDLGRSRGLLRERNEGRARLVPGTAAGGLGSGLAGRAEQVDPFLDDVLDRVDDRSDDLDDRVLVWVGLELCF